MSAGEWAGESASVAQRISGWECGNIVNHLQGDHLADTDHCAGRGYRLAVAKDSATLKKELNQISKGLEIRSGKDQEVGIKNPLFRTMDSGKTTHPFFIFQGVLPKYHHELFPAYNQLHPGHQSVGDIGNKSPIIQHRSILTEKVGNFISMLQRMYHRMPS